MPNSDLYCEGMFNYCSETRKCSLSKIKTSNKFPFTTVSKLNLRRSLIAVLEKHIGNTFKLRSTFQSTKDINYLFWTLLEKAGMGWFRVS